jgi:O-antigen/teichoic acid export membrane protein
MPSTTKAAPENLPGSHDARKFQMQMGRISRHSAVFFLGTIFRVGAGYLFKVYLARTLGPEPLGIYALGMTIIGFLGLFGGLGLPQAAVRFVAHYKASERFEQLRQFLASATAVTLAANVALGVAMLWAGPWLAVRFYHTPGLLPYLKLFAVIMILGAMTTFFARVLQGYKQVARLTVITDFVGIPLTMLVAIALIAGGAGLRGYILAQVLSAGVVLAILLRVVWKLTPVARDMKVAVSRPDSEVLNFSATVFGIASLSFVVSQSDKILIGFYQNARALGVYAVAAAVVGYIPLALQSVNQIFSPTITDLHTRGEGQLLGRVYQALTRWVLAFTFPLVMVIVVFARPLMRIFGADFEAGWLVLVIGAIGQLVNCGVGSVGYLLLMSGNEKRLIKVQLVAAGVAVALGVVLVPRWGIVGAALASAVTTILTNAWNLAQVRAVLGFLPYNRRSLRLVLPVTACALAVVCSKALFAGPRPAWSLILILAMAYAVFFAVSLRSGLDEDDRLIAGAAWAKIKDFLPAIDVGA